MDFHVYPRNPTRNITETWYERETLICVSLYLFLNKLNYLKNAIGNFVYYIMEYGAGVAQLVQRLVAGWTAEESGFDPQQGQEIFVLCTLSRPVPSQPLIQWILGLFPQE
jgi:hypothetical protein